MRLQALSLDFFGHFTGKQFDFGTASDSDPDFHVIYGPNEAGKTTLMEAYLRLLYGFSAREPYDFMHQRKNLRVSGVLQIDGASRYFLRLPTRKGSLRDDNDTPLPEAALQAHLAGLSMDDYRNLLCIDDETIEKGGEEIVNSQGDIGTLLFSAAAGIGDLSSVLEAVRDRADSLYKKRASNSRLLQLKSELRELDARIAEQDIPASQYKKLKTQLRASEETEQQLKLQRNDLNSEVLRIQKQLEALPLLTEMDELAATLAPWQIYPEKLDVDPERLVEKQANYQLANAEVVRLTNELDTCHAQMEKLSLDGVLDPDKLEMAEVLQQLEPLHARYTAAQLSLHAERRTLKDATQNLSQVACDILDADTDPSVLFIMPAAIVSLNESLVRRNNAARDASKAHDDLQEQEARLAEAVQAYAELAVGDSQEKAVSEIVNSFSISSLLNETTSALHAIDDARKEWQEALDSLTMKGQRFDDVPVCDLHSDEVDDIVSELHAVQLKIETAIGELEKLQVEFNSLQAKIGVLQAGVGLVDDEHFVRLKVVRSTAWQQHRQTYSADSADEFEHSMFELDAAMERRFGSAGDLGELRQLQQQIATVNSNADGARQQINELHNRKRTLEEKITNCITRAGLQVDITPMRAKRWILACEDAAVQAKRFQRIKELNQQTLERAEQCRLALLKHIPRHQASFGDLVRAATEINLRYEHRQQQLDRALQEQNQLKASLERDRAKADKLLRALEQAESDWQSLVAKSFPAVVEPQRLEAAMNSLHDVREYHRTRDAALQKVEAMEQDLLHFQTQVTALAERMDVPVQPSPDDTFSALKSSASESLDAQKRYKELDKLALSLQEQVSQHTSTIAVIENYREELAAQFHNSIPTSTIEELRKAALTAQHAIEKRTRKAQLQRQLLDKLQASDMAQAREQIEQLNISELQLRLNELTSELSHADESYRQSIERRSRIQTELAMVVGDTTVADLVQQHSAIELEMIELAMEHLKLSLGYRLASSAILRYREKHRSSMMAAAEQAFCDLTNGKYQQLKAQSDGASEKLVVLDNGVAKEARDLSKGTRFQLYLALRAAAYDQLLAQGTRLPFICDDIFETFDEQRTRAACHVMQRIGKVGQAIYLTHHKHVVDIAREVCGNAVTFHYFQ